MSDAMTARLVRVGVNMGDHAQDVVRAVEVREEDTVRDLMERVMQMATQWNFERYEDRIELQFVQPAPLMEGKPNGDSE